MRPLPLRAAVLLAVHAAAASTAADGFIAACADDACVMRALQRDGAVAVAVPGLAAARRDGLGAVARCTAGGLGAGVREVVLPDGTARRSLGARTVAGVAEELASGCDGLDAATASMRALVDSASRRFLRSLEPLRRGPSALLAADGRSYATLSAAAHAGEQLEHFHAYRPSEAAEAAEAAEVGGAEAAAAGGAKAAAAAAGGAEAAAAAPAAPAVALHVDAGLFIAIVPALHVARRRGAEGEPYAADSDEDEDDGPADGFFVHGAEGATLRVPPRSRASSVVFVLGDGWAQWLNPRLSSPLRAAPHGMAMVAPRERPAGGAAALQRARVWYGRMFLPPADAVQHPDGPPFAAWRLYHASHPAAADGAATASQGVGAAELAADGRASLEALEAPDAAEPHGRAAASLPSGCGGDRRFLNTADPNGCLEDQVWCWHQCIAHSCGPAGATCLKADGAPWVTADGHCTDCSFVCPSPSPPRTTPAAPPAPPRAPYEERFCTGRGTDMHMTGFELYPADCVILLFKEWKLDSAAAFVGGILGVFLLGVLTEALTWARRTKLAPSARLRRCSPRVRNGVLAFTFTVQVTLGYLLMLVAMTYQGELFIAVMLGLGVGHLCFNISAPVAESTDACCVEPVPAPSAKPAKARLTASRSAATRVVTLTVSPVNCENCVEVSEAALRKVPHVQSARVGRDGTAEVVLDERAPALRDAELVRALVAIGKAAEIVEPDALGNGHV